MPVVPPVYNMYTSSPGRLMRGAGVALRIARSKSIAPCSSDSVPSSIWIHSFTFGSFSRISQIRIAYVDWNTTASASALSSRYTSSSDLYR